MVDAILALLVPMQVARELLFAQDAQLESSVHYQGQGLRIIAQRVDLPHTLPFQVSLYAQTAPVAILMETHKPWFAVNAALIPILPMVSQCAHGAALEVL
jgi:hypothetical protein